MPNATITVDKEVRILPSDEVELRVVREDGKPTRLEGYAAVFDKWSVDMSGWEGDFREKIARGAFTNAIKSSDVRALWNHDPNFILGRTKSKTLQLSEDKRGLKFSIELPDTQTAKDTAASIERGDVDGCSFAFTTKSESWDYEADPKERTLTEVAELFDVGPVTYPAYPDTTVAARSIEQAQKQSRSMKDLDIDRMNAEIELEARQELEAKAVEAPKVTDLEAAKNTLAHNRQVEKDILRRGVVADALANKRA